MSMLKTVNPLDPLRGNFFQTHFPSRPGSDWLKVVPALWLADLRVPRPSRPGFWLVDSGPSSVIGTFEGAKPGRNESQLSKCIFLASTGKIVAIYLRDYQYLVHVLCSNRASNTTTMQMVNQLLNHSPHSQLGSIHSPSPPRRQRQGIRVEVGVAPWAPLILSRFLYF